MNYLLAYAELEEILGPQSTREEIEAMFRKLGYDDSMMQPHNMRVFMNDTRRLGLGIITERRKA
jgi:hypothetical protein